MFTPIPLTQNPLPGSTGFTSGAERPSLAVEFGPKAPRCPPQEAQAAAPTSLISASPGTPEAHSGKERSVRPQEDGWHGLGPGRDTCEPQHLRAKRGPPGLPRAHPLGRRVLRRGRNLRTCEARELQARAAPPHLSGSRSASASRCRRHCRRRWRPGHDELRAPPPCPPRRELHCGGEGMGRGRREGERKRRTRWGEGAEGEGEPGERGRGERDGAPKGVLTRAGVGNRCAGNPGEEAQREEFGGAPSLRSGVPWALVKPGRGVVNTNGGGATFGALW